MNDKGQRPHHGLQRLILPPHLKQWGQETLLWWPVKHNEGECVDTAIPGFLSSSPRSLALGGVPETLPLPQTQEIPSGDGGAQLRMRTHISSGGCCSLWWPDLGESRVAGVFLKSDGCSGWGVWVSRDWGRRWWKSSGRWGHSKMPLYESAL